MAAASAVVFSEAMTERTTGATITAQMATQMAAAR